MKPELNNRFRRIFDSQARFIFLLAARYGLQDADAADVCQRAFVVLARRLDEVEPGRERAFLCGTAVRIVSEVRRARARRREVSGAGIDAMVAVDSTPDQIAHRQRARAMLDELLVSMPANLREVFELHELHELTTARIARMLGIPMGTAASRLRRAREHFDGIVKRKRASGELPVAA